MATVDITQKDFESTVSADGIVLVDAWADWCGPCKRFAPVYDKASEDHADVTFAKLDTEANQELAANLQIQSIPTLFVFRDGVPVFRLAGALPPAALEDLIQQVKALDMDEVRKQYAERQQ